MSVPRQGEILWAEMEQKRRRVLVVTRSEAVQVLASVVVAPVTRTVREIPPEIGLGQAEGLAVDCVASFDNLQRIRRSALVERVGELAPRADLHWAAGTRRLLRVASLRPASV